MGCVCGKASSKLKDNEESPQLQELIRKSSQLHLAHAVSSKKESSFQNEKLYNGSSKLVSMERRSNVPERVTNNCYEKKVEGFEKVLNSPEIGYIPRTIEAESIAAGWPSWLVSVAGEAIRGWIPWKAESFEKLNKIGQGTYSNVYKGRDLIHNKFVALKKVRFNNMDPESVKFMAREITILRKLDHPNIIKLEGLITSKTSSSLYLVFEYMEHDLTGIASLPGIKFTEPQVKCYMQQLLNGLDYCHNHSILHRDIKGSNLLINNKGVLKIADFGLASYYDNQQKISLTSRVVTLWYRPPELLLGSTHYGVAVDLWSAGCILGELYSGIPIMTGRNEVEQLHNIFKLCGSPSPDYWKNPQLTYSPGFKMYRRRIAEAFKDLPDVAVALMETLLSIDPSDRGTASSALNCEYFKTEPFACDPSKLPKYPPSKEIDAKLREEEAKRPLESQLVKGMKGGNSYRVSKELRTGQAFHESTSEFARQMKLYNPRGHLDTKSQGEMTSSCKDDISRSVETQERFNTKNSQAGISYSGPFAPNDAWKFNRNLSKTEAIKQSGTISEAFGDPSQKQDINRQAKRSIINDEDDKNGETERLKDYHFSGPLVPSSNNKMEQVMRDHDRLIQEASRRIRQQEKARNNLPRDRHLASNHLLGFGRKTEL